MFVLCNTTCPSCGDVDIVELVCFNQQKPVFRSGFSLHVICGVCGYRIQAVFRVKDTYDIFFKAFKSLDHGVRKASLRLFPEVRGDHTSDCAVVSNLLKTFFQGASGKYNGTFLYGARILSQLCDTIRRHHRFGDIASLALPSELVRAVAL